jgi:hypothetical protein
MILDTANRSLMVTLLANVITTQLPVVVAYADHTTTTLTPGANQTNTNNTTDTEILAAPAGSTQRQLKYLNVFNVDTAAATVTIKYNDNTTKRILLKVTLAVGESLVFSDEDGWSISGTSGQTKTVFFAAPGSLDAKWLLFPSPPNAGTLTLIDQTIYAHYIATARKPWTSCVLMFRPTTAATSITWAEAAVLKGTPTLNGNPSLTSVGTADISAVINGTGIKSVTITLSGIAVGDNLWLAIASNSTGTDAVLRTLNYTGDVASGLWVTKTSSRPSTLAAGTTFTAQSTVPLWMAAIFS